MERRRSSVAAGADETTMATQHAIQQAHDAQRDFLSDLVETAWPGDVRHFETFSELADVEDPTVFSLILLELKPESSRQLEWVEMWGDRTVGMVSRSWEARQLESFLERGLSDYILKPYQPEKITRMVRARRHSSD